MKNLLFIVLTLFILNSCAIDSGPDPKLISKDKYVILGSGDWTPSKSDSKRALIAVEQYLKKPDLNKTLYSDDDELLENIGKIKKNITKYYVQIIGIRKNGKKIIHCNFFFSVFPEWKYDEVVIKDGGFGVWRIYYDPKTNKCSDMSVNGEA